MPAASGEEEKIPALSLPSCPPGFIDKCIADESLLRVIITDKYLDHLPLYRIGVRFERLGMVIPALPCVDGLAVSRSPNHFAPEAYRTGFSRRGYPQADETRIEVLPGRVKRRPGSPTKRKNEKRTRVLVGLSCGA